MHLILLAVGVLVAAVGVVMLVSSVPIMDLGAAALFMSGTIAVVGGLILLGLAVAVRSLNRIAERLEIQPLPVPPVVAVGREDPAPRPVRTAPDAAAVARPSLLGWLGRPSSPTPLAAGRADPPRAAQPAAPQNGAPVPPAVDLAALARPPEPVLAPPITVAPPPPPLRATPRPAPQRPVAPQNGTAGTTVYRSGVIDGIAYSLFMDGSIEAELPNGKVKFDTVDEMQKYLVAQR